MCTLWNFNCQIVNIKLKLSVHYQSVSLFIIFYVDFFCNFVLNTVCTSQQVMSLCYYLQELPAH